MQNTDDINRLATYVQNINSFAMLFQNNFDHYVDMRDFIFDSTIAHQDKVLIESEEGIPIEVSSLENNIIEIVKDFVKYSPSISLDYVTSTQDELKLQQKQLLENHIRYKIEEAIRDKSLPTALEQALSGGFTYLKVQFEPISDTSFSEEPIIVSVKDPRLISFDLNAKKQFKEDGFFWAEVIPMSEEDMQIAYPDKFDINNPPTNYGTILQNVWISSRYIGQKKLYFPCQYYEKIYKSDYLIQLADGSVLYKSTYNKVNNLLKGTDHEKYISPIVKSQKRMRSSLKRITFLGTEIYEELDMGVSEYPLIFVDGNSKYLYGNKFRHKETSISLSPLVTRSYLKSSVGAQRLKNLAFQRIANDVSDIRGADMWIPRESINQEDAQELATNGKPKLIITDAFIKDTAGMQPIPPPNYLVRPSVSAQLTVATELSDRALIDLSGDLKSSFKNGIPDNISGDAIRELLLADHSVAAPYLDNMLCVIQRLGTVLLSYSVSLYSDQRILTGMTPEGEIIYQSINSDNSVSLNVPSDIFRLTVKSDMNAAIAKSVTLRKLSLIFKDMPILAQFFNQQKGSYILSLLDLDNSSTLQNDFEKWQQQQQQLASQNKTPSVQDIELQNNTNKFEVEKAKLALKSKEIEIKQFVAKEKAIIDRLQTQLAAQQQQNDALATEQHRLRAEVDTMIALIHAKEKLNQ